MQLLIVEEQLRDARSHHLQYLRTIRNAALELGVDVVVAASVDFAEQKNFAFSAVPVLSDLSRLASSGAGGRWQRHGTLARNILANAGAVRRLVLSLGPFDSLFCLTAWWPQMAMLLIAKWGMFGKLPPIRLLFVNYPKMGKPVNAQFQLVRLLVRLLGKNVSLFAETKYARQAWEEFLGRPVHYVVHTVMPAELAEKNFESGNAEKLKREGTTNHTNLHERGEKRGAWSVERGDEAGLTTEDTEVAGPCLDKPSGAAFSNPFTSELAQDSENPSLTRSASGPASPATSYSLPVTAPEVPLLDAGRSTLDAPVKPVVFGFYGFARHEQGVDVLMRALEILKDQGEVDAEFRIVWPKAFQMPDGAWIDREMFGHLGANVRFFENPLSPADYLREFLETDWLILPYRVASYEGRCSRISIEACVMGIPVIYTKGTDLEEVMRSHGEGIGVTEEDAGALASAIRLAVQQNWVFQEKAAEKQAHASAIFSGRSFLEAILGKN
jgi:hypothetical protein